MTDGNPTTQKNQTDQTFPMTGNQKQMSQIEAIITTIAAIALITAFLAFYK